MLTISLLLLSCDLVQFGGFLLLNLLVGAILNNYAIIMQEQREKKNYKKNDINSYILQRQLYVHLLLVNHI